MSARILALLVVLFLPACRQPAEQPEPAPLTAPEREARVDALLAPAEQMLKMTVGARKAGITTFMKEGADFEPRVSGYLVPRIQGHLVQAGVTVIERKDLDKVVAELKQQMSDLFDEETQVELGKISGVEFLIMGTVQDLSSSVYRVKIKVVDVETAAILITLNVDIPRELLPVRFGGI